MANTQDEIYRIILKTEGEDKLGALVARLHQAEEALRQNIQASGQHSAATQANADAVRKLSDQVREAEKELRKLGSTKIDGRQLATQLGYMADDLQQFKNGAAAGMQAISNNIQPFLGLIPALAPFAGWIAIASIAIAQLYEHWDKISALWGQGHTKTQAEEIEELGKKTNKTAAETERLHKLETMRRNTKAQQEGRPAAVVEQEKQVNEAIGAENYDDVRKGVEALEGKKLLNGKVDHKLIAERDRLAAEEKGAKDAGYTGAAEDIGKRKDAAQARVDEAYGRAVTDFMAELATDKDKLRAFTDRAIKEKKLLGPDADKILRGLIGADPANQTTDADRAFLKRQQSQYQDAQKRKAEQDQFRENAADYEEKQLKELHDKDAGRRAEAQKFTAGAHAGPLGRLAEQGKLTDAAVNRGMRRAGYSKEDADRLAPHAARQLRDHADDQVRHRAASEGITTQEARKRMAREQDKAENDRLGAFDNGRLKADDEARETVGHGIAAALQAGGDLGAIRKQMFAGLKDQYGEGVAKMLVNRGTRDGLEEHGRAMEDFRKQHKSQVLDTAGLADSIQAGVGGGADYQKQAVDQLKKANEALNKMLQRPTQTAPILQR